MLSSSLPHRYVDALLVVVVVVPVEVLVMEVKAR